MRVPQGAPLESWLQRKPHPLRKSLPPLPRPPTGLEKLCPEAPQEGAWAGTSPSGGALGSAEARQTPGQQRRAPRIPGRVPASPAAPQNLFHL